MDFDKDKFRTLISVYTSLFTPANAIRQELEEGEFVEQLVEDFNLNPTDTNPFRTRQYNLMAHTNALTDYQNFLMQQMHAMLKQIGFEGEDPNDYHIPCDMARMKDIWEKLSRDSGRFEPYISNDITPKKKRPSTWSELAFDTPSREAIQVRAELEDIPDPNTKIEDLLMDTAIRTLPHQEARSFATDVQVAFKTAPEPGDVQKIFDIIEQKKNSA